MNDDQSPTPATPTAPDSAPGSVGRFTRAQLEAMVGKRGRKPAEFYVLFPKTDAEGSAPAARPKRTRAPRAAATPRVSSAILGDHSIDDLLAKAGAKGAKPPAYHILVAAAEHLVAAGAVEAPIADPLARRVAQAPAKVRALVTALLDAAT